MPFNSTDFRIPEIDPATYQARRAQAALMWLRIPPAEFDMRYFRSCALGWLAAWEVDGWYWDKLNGEPRCRVSCRLCQERWPVCPCATYFGLTVNQADLCFGWDRWTAIFRGRWRIERLSLGHFRELTRIAEHELHEAVLSCTRARRQTMQALSAMKPVLHW
jgi:hypothetical protein